MNTTTDNGTKKTGGYRIAIIGGGPGGTSCALALHKMAAERSIDLKITILEGKDFFPHSWVRFNGDPISTSFLSQEKLVATLPSHLVRPGTFPVVVINPRPREFPDRENASDAQMLIVKFAKPISPTVAELLNREPVTARQMRSRRR